MNIHIDITISHVVITKFNPNKRVAHKVINCLQHVRTKMMFRLCSMSVFIARRRCRCCHRRRRRRRQNHTILT